MNTKLYFRCEMSIDQNRYISSDPISHMCMNDAHWETPEGYLICDRCRFMMHEEPYRLTPPVPPYGRSYQIAIIKKVVGHMLSQKEHGY